MWQIYLESKQALSQSPGETFSPPVFAVMTERGLKIIEKKDGDLEVYDLKESLVENRDLAPALSPEVLENYRHLLEHLKTETGFQEAVAARQAPADQRAAWPP
jgi:hypothetical protein